MVLAAYSEFLVQKFTEFACSEVVSIDLTQYPPVAVFAVLSSHFCDTCLVIFRT